MKFEEVKAVFVGWRVCIIALNEQNGTTEEEISLLETVDAYDKLARYNVADVLRMNTVIVEQNGERYPTLDVTVRV